MFTSQFISACLKQFMDYIFQFSLKLDELFENERRQTAFWVYPFFFRTFWWLIESSSPSQSIFRLQFLIFQLHALFWNIITAYWFATFPTTLLVFLSFLKFISSIIRAWWTCPFLKYPVKSILPQLGTVLYVSWCTTQRLLFNYSFGFSLFSQWRQICRRPNYLPALLR